MENPERKWKLAPGWIDENYSLPVLMEASVSVLLRLLRAQLQAHHR